jgi:hypothetical protein
MRMSGFTHHDPLSPNALPLQKSTAKVSKQKVIDDGVMALRELGTESICKVCIANHGSCCNSCWHLSDGVGCQRRNTSCTAWLCGFLKYMLYETDLLQEWNDFWDQVPGKDYRTDFTPEYFFVQQSLPIHNLRNLSEAFSADLEELAGNNKTKGFILQFREKLDSDIDLYQFYKNDPKRRTKIKWEIEELSRQFHRFHKALIGYCE